MECMSMLRTHPWLRWAAPVLTAVLLAGGGAAATTITADAGAKLPHRSAAQLLADVSNAKVHGLSGTVVENADLGLPALPDVGGDGSSNLSSLVSGSHTWRVWYAGPERMRLSLVGSAGESDIVRDGTDLWGWSSQTKRASHLTIPAEHGKPPTSARALARGLTPQQVARQALKAIEPSTKVSTSGTATVAGRSAYELVLRPRDHRSLVGAVRIAIDGASRVPTRVQVIARDTGKPAFEVGFTSFTPRTPDPSVFRFNPPPGTKVTKGSPFDLAGGMGGLPAMGKLTAPQVVGHGWTTVLVGELSGRQRTVPSKRSGMDLGALLSAMPKVSGPWGSGRLLHGPLFSLLLTNDGRVAVGAVQPAMLYHALGKVPAASAP
jgi:outer membrane lipoprotein-sorting protein